MPQDRRRIPQTIGKDLSAEVVKELGYHPAAAYFNKNHHLLTCSESQKLGTLGLHSLSPRFSIHCSKISCKRNYSGASQRAVWASDIVVEAVKNPEKANADQAAELEREREDNRELRSQVATLINHNRELQQNVTTLTKKVDETLEQLQKMQQPQPTFPAATTKNVNPAQTPENPTPDTGGANNIEQGQSH